MAAKEDRRRDATDNGYVGDQSLCFCPVIQREASFRESHESSLLKRSSLELICDIFQTDTIGLESKVPSH